MGLRDTVCLAVFAALFIECKGQEFFAMGGLQVVGVGAIAVQLEATKSATFRCRLNDSEFVDCVDGQIFQNLAVGTYTLYIEATATNNSNEVAHDTVGPALLAAGANASISETIDACFGRQEIHCDRTNEHCEYVATWRTRGDRVEFNLVAQTQGWVGIGFSTNRTMSRSDIIVGAASTTEFFVDDRYAEDRAQPPRDTVQNVDNPSASFVDGVTAIQFSRDKVTGDSEDDLSLSVCRYLLYAWSGNVNIETGVIQFHGSQNQTVSETLLCFPTPSLCPERSDCGDPGTPVDGNRNFTDTLEGSIVTYTCDDGFELVGNSTQTCKLTPDGAFWSDDRPQCRPAFCGFPGIPTDGETTIHISSDGVVLTAMHFCNEGFTLNGANQRTCLSNGSWSDQLPTCVIVDCGDPGTPSGGFTIGTLLINGSGNLLIPVITTTFGSAVNHTCPLEGDILVGAHQRECLANGSWSAPLPICKTIDCGDPGVPTNGNTITGSSTFGSIVTYTCNTGFALNGVNQRRCLESGSWSQTLPTCVLSDCGDPGTPANGSTIGDTFTFGSIINQTCNVGFVNKGPSQRECLANTSWSGSLPTCNIIDCGDPGRPVDGTTTGTSTTFGSVVIHACNEDYLLSGETQRECLLNGMWSAPLPLCRNMVLIASSMSSTIATVPDTVSAVSHTVSITLSPAVSSIITSTIASTVVSIVPTNNDDSDSVAVIIGAVVGTLLLTIIIIIIMLVMIMILCRRRKKCRRAYNIDDKDFTVSSNTQQHTHNASGAKVDPSARLETVNALYIPTNVKSIDSLLQRIRSRSGSNVIITPNPSYTVDTNSLQSVKKPEHQYEYVQPPTTSGGAYKVTDLADTVHIHPNPSYSLPQGDQDVKLQDNPSYNKLQL